MEHIIEFLKDEVEMITSSKIQTAYARGMLDAYKLALNFAEFCKEQE